MKNILLLGFQSKKRGVFTQIQTNYPDYIVHHFLIYTNKRQNILNFDLMTYIDQASRYCVDNHIDGVTFKDDIGALAAAVVCKEFQFIGPSIEAAFDCYHKYYTRKKTPPCVGYQLWNIADPLPANVTYPFYLKAPGSSLGVLGFRINSKQDIERYLPIIAEQLPQLNNPVNPFVSKYFSNEFYKDAGTNGMLIEELQTGPQVTVEGYVYNGEIITTAITDTNNYDNSSLIDNFSTPSRLSAYHQQLIRDQAIKDVSALKLNNTFFNCEYWISHDQAILIEVNCRAASTFTTLNKVVYNFDLLKGMLDLCVGKKPENFPENKGVGGQCNVVTKKTGNSSDIFDYNYPCPASLKVIIPPQTELRMLSDYGMVLGRFHLFGDTYEAIKQQADEYRTRALW